MTTTPLAAAFFGPTEIILIIAILTLLFGASRIPMLARGLGEGIRNFKGALRGGEEEPGDGESENQE